MTHVSRRKEPLTARRGTNSGNKSSAMRCAVCLGPVGQGKKICSPRCRLVKWGAYALLKACREGRAGGLCDIIEELRKT
jgi:hypothetical protein